MTTVTTCTHPYAIGAGGIGVSAIIRYWRSRDIPVVGTDVSPSVITEQLQALGAELVLGDSPAALPPEVDYVIYSEAAPPNHPLRMDAERKGIPCRVYAAALGELLQSFAERVVITGTNGKSSTTALTGWLLAQAGKNPSVVVGSLVPQLGSNYRAGERLMIVEGDEYREHVLQLPATRLLITNIAFDHPDAFQNEAAVHAVFHKAVAALPASGTVYLNADDTASRDYGTVGKTVKWFSTMTPSVDVCVRAVGHGASELFIQGQSVGTVQLQYPGEHQRANAAAAALLASDLGLSPPQILAGLNSFRGLWRRLELIGTLNGAPVISDYAHHPDAVAGAVAAVKEQYPDKTIVAVFQPHHEARLRALHNEFAQSLRAADVIRLVPVYAVTGRDDTTESVFPQFVQATSELSPGNVSVLPLDQLQQLQSIANPDTVILAMSAGSLDAAMRTLV